MPLATTYVIECSVCGAYAWETREPEQGVRAPAFVVPPGWTEEGSKHFCPVHTAEREAQP